MLRELTTRLLLILICSSMISTPEVGGMRGDKLSISSQGITDNINLDITADYEFMPDNLISKTVTLKVKEGKKQSFSGRLSLDISDIFSNKNYYSDTIPVLFTDTQSFLYTFSIPSFENSVAKFTVTDRSGNSISTLQEIPYLLTPKEIQEPKINGAAIFGASPGKPILFTVPASGERPLKFSAINLPAGLMLDEEKGIIKGLIKNKGEYKIKVTVSNSKGKDERVITGVVGDMLALTPPMGWNSWNCWGMSVNEEKVKSSAEAMIRKGLINYGWTYINIDDGWQGKRDENGKLHSNQKFPDMKNLIDNIHSMGLKVGIYSSPGPKTCGGMEGSYKYEGSDAHQFATWGVDYLKYDLCSYNDLPVLRESMRYNTWIPIVENQKQVNLLMHPYKVMERALESTNRDIVYSICQYGFADVWKWGATVNGNLWRTTGDITDSWQSVYDIGFKASAPLYSYSKPGRWNDPDMLVVGKVGWGEHLHNTHLTVNEQYTHISLWALLSAPLLIGCDMSKLDDFTLNLLTNREVIAVNQDILGQQAKRILNNPDYQVWMKELADGSRALGIFNASGTPKKISFETAVLNIKDPKKIRDLWRQKDIGVLKEQIETLMPPHGVTLLKIY